MWIFRRKSNQQRARKCRKCTKQTEPGGNTEKPQSLQQVSGSLTKVSLPAKVPIRNASKKSVPRVSSRCAFSFALVCFRLQPALSPPSAPGCFCAGTSYSLPACRFLTFPARDVCPLLRRCLQPPLPGFAVSNRDGRALFPRPLPNGRFAGLYSYAKGLDDALFFAIDVKTFAACLARFACIQILF